METQLATYILEILRSNPYIVMSWGAHNFHAVENGLGFDVDGFVYSGRVEVIYNEGLDLFEIWKVSGDERTLAQGYVYADEVVSVIDGLVEKNCSQDEYARRISAEYGY